MTRGIFIRVSLKGVSLAPGLKSFRKTKRHHHRPSPNNAIQPPVIAASDPFRLLAGHQPCQQSQFTAAGLH